MQFVTNQLPHHELCDPSANRRGPEWGYRLALEAALLDRARACPAEFYLLNAPDTSRYRKIKNSLQYMDFSILNLTDAAMQMYFAGLALAFREIDDPDLRHRALETAALLVSVRGAEQGYPLDADWQAFMRFLAEINETNQQRPLAFDPSGQSLLPECMSSWCDLTCKRWSPISVSALKLLACHPLKI